MPFCPRCGSQVQGTDRFCSCCGAPQPGARPGPAAHGPSEEPLGGGSNARTIQEGGGLSNRSASILCYVPVVGWIVGLLVLATGKFKHERVVRFHAFQGLYLFVTWLLVDLVFDNFGGGIRGLRWLINPLKLALIATWIYLLIKTGQGSLIKLPFLGELAERSVDEQEG